MRLENQIIYLDNNASTQVDKRVLDAMLPFLTENYANANSTHQMGLMANDAVNIARNQVADLIGADGNEIIFTSGSTEAINLAIKGVAEKYSWQGKHIITVSTEHLAVIDSCKYLETIGFDVTYLSVQSDGLINMAELKRALKEDTILVCVMYVNNETGVIQPIKEIATLAHSVGAIFMSDTTQAIGKMPIDVDDLGIDLLCLSGHKLYAPKGIGALYIRQRNPRIKIPAQLHGGGHERGFRSGTLNVPCIVALGQACKIANEEMNIDTIKIRVLRDNLEKELLKIQGAYLNGNKDNRIFNVSNICFKGTDANVTIGRLKYIAISNGSACSSAIFEPSHVLISMGLNDEDAFASLRFSLGKFNTENEIQKVISLFREIFIIHA